MTPSPTWTARKRVAAALVAACGLTAAGLLSLSPAYADEPVDPVQRTLDALVQQHGFPGALAFVHGADGSGRDLTAGVGDLATGDGVPVDGEVRIGSNTKTFVATVVLQLVGEGRVGLDTPVDAYLPGLVTGQGIDGKLITVRQLLQHTSGLPNYTDAFTTPEQLVGIQHTYFAPRTLLDMALRQPATFPPGTAWAYSNTNYVVAGLLVEAVTGRPLGEVITTRVIEPLGLAHTYFPGVGEQVLRGPHPHGYDQDPTSTAPPLDVTEMDPSWGWAAGQIVSTPRDMDRFIRALFGGELLEPAQLEQMRTTVDTGTGGARYGLGVFSRPLSCGRTVWGHNGGITGFSTAGGTTDDGRSVQLAVTALATDPAQPPAIDAVVDAALCG
jgi:D-alanyl-D-alanine carboxypeptidase